MKNTSKSKNVFSWIWTNGRKSMPSVALLTVIAVINTLIGLRFAIVSKAVLDIATNQQEGSLLHSCLQLFIMLLLQLILQISVNFINVKANAKLDMELKRNVFRTLIGKDYLSVTKYHSGELLNRLTSDISIITNGIITIIPHISLLLTSIIGAFIILFNLDRTFAVLVLLLGPALIVCARLYSKRYKQLHKDCQQADGKTRSFMQETLQNILVIKSFNNQTDILDHSEELQKNAYRLKLKRVMISIVAHICMYLAFNAGYYFALAYGAYKLSLGLITFGTVTAMLQLVGRIQTPFKDISSIIPQFYSVTASVERINELEDMKDEETSTDTCSYADMESIVYENVVFGYEENKKILDGSCFEIRKGEFAVIGGESGIGKSTAIKLLLGIMKPDCGEIYIKTHKGRVPVGTGTRGLFAYVPQGNLILSGTIRENVTFGNKNANDDDVIEALKLAQIWDYIETLPDGLDTVLGEHGLGMSEGQIQRVSIARALLYDAPVLLLDESTSALDSITEESFLKTLKQMTDKTVIIISHKKAAFDVCDKVIKF